MKRNRSKELAAFVVVALCVCSVPASAVTLPFNRITSNSETDVADQLFVDVTAVIPGVQFKFYNNGPVLSSISEIYFYDGALLDMYSIDDALPNVNFEDIGDNTNPKTLPGYNPPSPLLQVLSATEAESPEPAYGVKPGEWVTIVYTLQSGKSYQDLLDDLLNEEVVIGLHVKAIGSSMDSDSFTNEPIPEPATIALFGLGGLFLLRRRKA